MIVDYHTHLRSEGQRVSHTIETVERWVEEAVREPTDLGRDLDLGIEHARAAGYETVTVFEGRGSRQEPLG